MKASGVLSRVLLVLSLIISIFFLASCKDLYTQDLTKIFKDGKIPRQLALLQTQFRELSLQMREKIVERTKKDAERKDLLTVAVVDSGVDLAHPDLIEQLAFQVKDGKIVGAGRDLMGNTNFGSQVLINPTLFSFGAKSAKDGEITGALESPLAFLAEMNSFFVDRVLAEIAANPSLQKSYFARLNAKNFTVFGYIDMYVKPQRFLEYYKRNLAEGNIIGIDTKIDKNSPRGLRRLAKELKQEWIYEESENRPFDSISSLEHFDVFLEAVNRIYDETDKKYFLKHNVLQLENFSNDKKVITDFNDDLKALSTLKETMSFILFGYRFTDPIENLRKSIVKDGRYAASTFTESFQKMIEATRKKIDELKQNKGLDSSELHHLSQSLRQLEVLLNIGRYIDSISGDPKKYQSFLSDLRREYYRGSHPYIAQKTLENSHATHVAGTIAKQNPRIRILPVRATTEEVRQTKSDKDALVSKYLKGFSEWLKTEMAQELRHEILKEYKMSSIADGLLEKQAKRYLVANTLNAQFIDDVLASVDYLGENKVKISNFSLGTVFKKSYSLSQKIPSLTEDLFAEYVRYIIGDRIQRNAPGTLFLIATGNDGAWLDGVSKTGFPVGVTSLRAMQISNLKKIPMPPNNQIKNILAVGSISRGQTLTEFTNVLIDPNTAQVFSVGEDVMSTTPAKADSRTAEVVASAFGKLSLFLTRLVKLEMKNSMDKDQSLDNMIDSNSNVLPDGMLEVTDTLGKILKTMDPVTRQRMSGTSMATPTATGLVAEYILEKMDRLKVPESEIYLHPEFQPNVVVREVLELARKQASTLGRIITVDMLLKGIEEWKISRTEGRARHLMKTLTTLPKAPKVVATGFVSCEALF